MKETVADAFISRFQLKPDEVQALKGTRNGPISEVCIMRSCSLQFGDFQLQRRLSLQKMLNNPHAKIAIVWY